jgi:aquaporin Z
MSIKEMLLYWVAQFVGAIIASAVLFAVWKTIGGLETGVFAANGFGENFQAATENADYQAISMGGAFLVEALLTFVFLMVILGATDERSNTKAAGLAIGLTLTLIHLVSIPLTNTSVNPARSLGQAIFASWDGALPQVWLFIVAPLVGAGLAGLFYKVVAPKKA